MHENTLFSIQNYEVGRVGVVFLILKIRKLRQSLGHSLHHILSNISVPHFRQIQICKQIYQVILARVFDL